MTPIHASSLALAFGLACSTPAASTGEPHARRQDETSPPASEHPGIDRIFELSSELRLPRGASYGWLPDAPAYLAANPEDSNAPPWVVQAASGEHVPLYDADAVAGAWERLPEIDASTARSWTRRTRGALTPNGKAVLLNANHDLFWLDLEGPRARRLTHDPIEEVGETVSPDGAWVGYVRDHDLWVVPTGGGSPRALTAEGDENHLYGRLDWVYQEEVYGRGNWQGFWWSPDSRRIAFLILDESEVPEYAIPDHREVHPKVEVWRYPKAGDPNPKVRVAVVDVAGGEVRELDLSRYASDEPLVVRVGWTPDASEVLLQVQDRVQTWLDVVAADPETGKTRVLFRETTPAWVEPTDAPFWIPPADPKGRSTFLWLSERDGWRHLYHYDLEGKLLGRLTSGRWEVDRVHGYDPERRVVWFSGDRADVKGQQLFRIGLDGQGLEQVTREPGTHRVSFSSDFDFYTDSFSSHAVLPRLTLHRADGARVRELARVPDEAVAKADLLVPEFVQVPTRDGFLMEAMLIRPPDFDPGRRYPVVSHTYSGPHAPMVRDAWMGFNALYHQMLAREGYLIWICDNRSASGKGLESAATVYRNLGPLELQDLEDGLDWLVAQGYADPERIALWGWSYGGFMTSYALTHSKRFKLGIVGAPVTDWRLYDTIYTERYMDRPQSNPEGYARTSVVEAAAELSGRALLIHGVIDENVHMQNTLQLANALQDAGKSFQMMLYPGNRHGIVRSGQRRHLYAMMADFIRQNL